MRLRRLHLLPATVLLLALGGVAHAELVGGPSLSDRVLRPNELAGFVPAHVQTVKDVNAWAKIAPGALVNVVARLRFEGFVAAVREDPGSLITIKLDLQGHGIGKLLIPLFVRRKAQDEMPRNMQKLKERLERTASAGNSAISAE